MRPFDVTSAPSPSRAQRVASSTRTGSSFVKTGLWPGVTHCPSETMRPRSAASHSGSGVEPNTGTWRAAAIRSPAFNSDSSVQPENVRNGWFAVARISSPIRVVRR